MFNYLHKKFYTKFGHILLIVFTSLPVYLKSSEPDVAKKNQIKYWKNK